MLGWDSNPKVRAMIVEMAKRAAHESILGNTIRPSRYSVVNHSEVPRFFIRVLIPEAVHVVQKGFLGDTKHVSYQIEVDVYFLYPNQYIQFDTTAATSSNKKGNSSRSGDGNPIPFNYRVERRHSEFKALCYKLYKYYPNLLIPSLPNSTSSASVDVKIEIRKRRLQLWLQHLAGIESLHNSETFINFVAGVPSLYTEDSNNKKKLLANTKRSPAIDEVDDLYVYSKIYSSSMSSRQREIDLWNRALSRNCSDQILVDEGLSNNLCYQKKIRLYKDLYAVAR